MFYEKTIIVKYHSLLVMFEKESKFEIGVIRCIWKLILTRAVCSKESV